jgi:predicted nuclease of predicted toxin-antitoxin system
MIKLLADENFPLASVEILEKAKYNILSISKSHWGISDIEIIKLSNQEERLILTFDRDFGQLIFKEDLIPKNGVFYFRLQKFSPLLPAQIVLDLLSRPDFEIRETITVIEDNFIRQKKF